MNCSIIIIISSSSSNGWHGVRREWGGIERLSRRELLTLKVCMAFPDTCYITRQQGRARKR